MMIIKPAQTLAFAVLMLSMSTSLRAEERMRAGLWEVTITSDGKAGSIGNTCYTPAMVEMANMPTKELLEFTTNVSAKRGCTVKDFRVERNKISMVKACPGSVAEISSTYSGDAFETVDTTTRDGATKAIRMKGRRLGDCK